MYTKKKSFICIYVNKLQKMTSPFLPLGLR
jgi:hypothetical protein